MAQFRTVFITVGTTSFKDLIDVIDTKETAEILKKIGCERLILQFGKPVKYKLNRDWYAGIELEEYDLKSSILPDIEQADLVIGHAGAGTCLEVLKAGKPLIVVINDTLMDNHQTELSRALTSQGLVVSCTTVDLPRTLARLDVNKLRKLRPGRPEAFLRELDLLLGYV